MSERSKKIKFGVLIAIAIILILSFFLKAYWIRNESGGWLFWNTEDAYIFINVRVDGFRPTYLGLVGQEIEAIFPFGAPTPDEKHLSVLVLHVTLGGVKQYTIDNCWLGSGPEPFHGELYAANMITGKDMKWSYDHFEPISEEKQLSLQAALRGDNNYFKSTAGPSYDHVEGWSKRTVAGNFIYKTENNRTVSIENDSRLTIKVAGQNLTFLMNSGFVTRHGYIDLVRSGQPPERIWRWDEYPHLVSRAEYDRIFAYPLAQEAVNH